MTETVSLETVEAAPVVAPPAQAPTVRPVKVCVCLPSGRSWEARTSTSVAGLCAFSVMHGIDLGIINLEGSMISKQRNDLVKMARDNKADYVLFVDTDMVMPPDALLRLLQHNKDIVGATYNKRVPPYETLGRLRPPKPSDAELMQGGIWPADQLPGGLVLIRMSVFEKLKFPWYFEIYQWPGENGTESLKEYLRNAHTIAPPEDVLASLDGTALSAWLNETCAVENQNKWEYYSEDLNMCRKAIKNGVEMFCDLGLTYNTKHLGILEVTCNLPQAVSVIEPAEM